MLSDGQLLLKAICADPDADLPRLVYADYLDDKGQPDRAALVRLQCEFVRKCQAGNGLADDVLRTELAVLWAAHGERWRAEFPQIQGVDWDLFFHRGFAERVVVETDAILRDNAEAILGLNPIHHLRIRRFTGARGVTLIPALRHLKSATITVDLTHAAFDELLAWNGFRGDFKLVLHPGSGPGTGRVAQVNAHFRHQLFRPLT